MSQTVLIVDDDPVQRRLLEAAIRRLGYAPMLAETGEAALALLRAGEAVDILVLDLVMPGIDGFGVLAGLKEAGIERHQGKFGEAAGGTLFMDEIG